MAAVSLTQVLCFKMFHDHALPLESSTPIAEEPSPDMNASGRMSGKEIQYIVIASDSARLEALARAVLPPRLLHRQYDRQGRRWR